MADGRPATIVSTPDNQLNWEWAGKQIAVLQALGVSQEVAIAALQAAAIASVPQVRVTKAANLAVATTTLTPIPWDQETFDQGTPSNNMHDNVTLNTRLTCRVAGLYVAAAQIYWQAAAGAGQRRFAEIFLNSGVEIARDDKEALTLNAHSSQPMGIYRLAVGDYVECIVLHDTVGSPLNVVAAQSWFSAYRVGP